LADFRCNRPQHPTDYPYAIPLPAAGIIPPMPPKANNPIRYAGIIDCWLSQIGVTRGYFMVTG
jgi:hypothetical protein